jgi:hypothetical protein
MTVALLIFGIAFAAFCVWLTVRIINRRENSDNEFLVTVCVAALLLFLVVGVPSIGLYWAFNLATRPKSGAAKMAVPPPAPVRPAGR